MTGIRSNLVKMMAESARPTIILAIKKVAEEHKRTLAPLTDDLMLLELGTQLSIPCGDRCSP